MSTPSTIPDVEFRGKVRAHDIDTSWDAAERQTRRKTAVLYVDILKLLRSTPSTDDELMGAYTMLHNVAPELYRKASPQSIRSRRSELVTAGLVRASKKPKRPSDMGGPSTVWEVIV